MDRQYLEYGTSHDRRTRAGSATAIGGARHLRVAEVGCQQRLGSRAGMPSQAVRDFDCVIFSVSITFQVVGVQTYGSE